MTDNARKSAVLLRLVAPFVCAATVGSDILAKAWAREALTFGVRTPFIPGFLRFTLTTNTGAAFGMGKDNGIVMAAVALAITAFFIYLLVKKERDKSITLLERIAMGLIIGGGLGNLFDRLMRGSVTDFLEFAFITFPVFNLADICIDVGGGLFALSFLLDQAKPKHQM